MKQILWFCFVVTIATYICGPLIDPDLWWHITSGRWIVANFDVPHVDYWNMFARGQPWQAYSWSNEILFALVDGWFGQKGLLVLQMLFAAILACSLSFCLGKIAADWFFGGLVGLFVTAATFNHFSLRPQVLVWVYFVWLLCIAVRIDRQGLNWPRRVMLFILMSFWANTHISSVLGIMAVFLWLRRSGRGSPALQAALICFAGTFVTPYLGGEWVTLLHKSLHPFMYASVTEFQPAHILQRSTGLFLILLALLGLFLQRRPAVLEISKLLGVLIFSLAAFATVKFLPFAGILIGVCLAEIWSKAGADKALLGNLGEGFEKLRRLFDTTPREGLAFVLICLSIVNILKVWREPPSENVLPVAALDFILEKKLSFPLLNDFSTGGYVMYRLSDRQGNLSRPVSMDGRTNLISRELWEKEIAAFFGRPDWREYLEAVKPATILWRSEAPLASILLYGREWCRVLRTGGAERGYSVFLKQSEFELRKAEFRSDNCP